jgi:insertion element IS1 protein InsB
VTAVDRASRCILGWQVLTERTSETMQAVIDGAPTAYRYYSDAFPTYATLVYYPGQHLACADKSQTYSVEADNAELRHYLARLARKSRCFSRCLTPHPFRRLGWH